MKDKRTLSYSTYDCKYHLFGFRNTGKGSIWSLEKTQLIEKFLLTSTNDRTILKP
jgi:hypothetical protein